MAAIELGIPYYFYTPNQGNYFAVNAPADANFCGYVDDITGLDSPGIRENAQVVVAGDGGYHGPFWLDRRPFTYTGFIVPSFPLLARDQAQERMEGIILQAKAADGLLTWTPADGIQRMLAYRAQQPPRITTGQSKVEKRYTLALVTADWRVVSWATHVISATGVSPLTLPTVQNLGNADASLKFILTGPYTTGNITITNTSTGKALVLDNVAISAGQSWTIDLTGKYPAVTDQSGNSQLGTVDPLLTDWSIAAGGSYTVTNGNNTFTVTGSGTTSASGLSVTWRHSWV